jgi:hypothetical protein
VSDSEHDDDFEAYLKRRVPIHKGGTPPDHLEPPPELDRIIIGNARRAIQGASPVRLYQAPKWALPAGLAATIVISSVVVLELGLRAKQPAPEQEPVETELVAEAPVLDATPPARAIAAPDAAVPETSTSGHEQAAKSRGHRGGAKAAKRIRLPAIPTIPWPPVVTPNTAPSMAADAAGQADDEKARTRLARIEVAAARLRDDEAPTARSSGPAPASPAPPARLDAATWLRQIEKLRSEGQTAEAERQLKLFRAVYPDYPVADATASADDRGQ